MCVGSGLFNLKLRQVLVSFATVPVPDLGIPAGMVFKSDVSFLGMDTKTDIRLENLGRMDVALSFGVSELHRVRTGHLAAGGSAVCAKQGLGSLAQMQARTIQC